MPKTYIHPCPVDGCTRTRKTGQNMCAWHWAALPSHLSVAVLDTWDATVRDERSETTWRTYLTARDEALHSIPGYDMAAADLIDREALAEVDALTNV